MKTKILKMSEEFGSFCAEGSKALGFLASTVFPSLDGGNRLVFDFRGVRNMNSSFSNALFANLVRKYGESVLKEIKVINTRGNVKHEVSSSVNFGIKQLNTGNVA